MRIPTYVWDFLLAKTYELFAGTIADVAIDSTGYRLHHASQHYEKKNRKAVQAQTFHETFPICGHRQAGDNCI